MSFNIRQYYETVLIKDKVWFVCKYNDCGDCEVREEDILCHIRQHLDPQTDDSNDVSDDEMITAHPLDDFSEEDSMPEIKPQIEVIALPINQTSGSSQESNDYLNGVQTTNGFKCHIDGCGKTFLYLRTLMSHKNDHKIRVKSLKNVVKPPVKQQFKAQTKPTANLNLNFNYNNIKDKYLRVQRLNDRSIHRWQKQDHRSDANYAGMQSLKNLNQYYRKDIIDNEKYYMCQYNQSCPFKTKRSQHMARHLNCCHFRTRIFRCSVRGCDRKYYNPTSLRQHTLNHKCGFGILNGKTMTTLCGNKSINRFRMRIIESDLKLYKCNFLDCPFKTKSHTCIKRHIHDQHLCPNRVKYLDEDIVPQIMPTEQMSQSSGIPQNNAIPPNIVIPQMIEMRQIRRVTPKKRPQNRGLEIIPLPPELTPMPPISGIPEMMEIPVSPLEMPILKIKEEVREQPANSYSVQEMIDGLINGTNDDNINDNYNHRKNLNSNQMDSNEDSNESNDEIQILDEFIGQQRTPSPEFRNLIEVKNVKLDYSKQNFNKCKNELESLNRCRAHFDRKIEQNVGLRYVCKCCRFPAKSLEAISMHLRLKHFIDN